MEKERMNKKSRSKKLIVSRHTSTKFSILTIFLVLVFITLTLQISAAGYTRTSNYNALGGVGKLAGGFFGETPGQFDRSMCEAGQDFVLQIAPFGCSPAVVRSDLLEEENVPIYCQIAATQINPLVDVKAIEYISFSGQTPPGVAGVGFHPNQAALGTGRGTTLDNYPVLDNIGYAVIVLNQQPNESSMPDFVEGNLTAKIKYNIENAFGVGQATYYLPLLNENEFEDRYKAYGFWDGRGFLKAESIDVDGATVSIYSGRTGAFGDLQRMNTVSLIEGTPSEKIYMTGFNYCLANLRLRLDDITYPTTRARIKINADIYEVADGEKFLDGKCEVLSVEKYGFNEDVEISCREDTNSGLFGGQAFKLRITPKVNVEVNGEKRSVGLGDFIGRTNDGKNNGIYVAYIGSQKNTNKDEDLQIIFITFPEIVEKLDENTIEEISSKLGPLYEDSTSTSYLFSGTVDVVKFFAAAAYRIGRNLLTKESVDLLNFADKERDIKGVKIKITGFSGAVNAQLDEQTREYYQNAIDDYDEVLKSFPTEKYNSVELGKDTYKKKINFASSMQQKRAVIEFCDDFKGAYPEEPGFFICENIAQLSSDTISARHVTINGKVKEISLDGIYEPTFEEYGIEGYVRKAGDATSAPTKISLRNKEIYYLDADAGEYIQLDEIKDENNVNLIVKATALDTREAIRGVVSTGRLAFREGVTQVVGKYEITIQEINIKRVAQVSVLPNIDYAGTETTFKFKVGIEKRNALLKLSPEQARDKINRLDAEIKNWEDISSKLGTVVTTLKTACLATGALFTVENLIGNLDGKGLARQKVMRNSGGWYDQCKTWVKEGTSPTGERYSTLQECLFENSDRIDADVERYYQAQTAQNKEIKDLQKLVNKGGLFSEDIVNRTALIKDYSAKVRGVLENCAGTEITNPSKPAEKIEVSEVSNALSFELWEKNRNYNFEELRDIGFYCKVLQGNPNDAVAKQKLYSIMYNVNENSKGYAEAQNYATSLGVSTNQVRFVNLDKAQPYEYLGLTYDKLKSSFVSPGIGTSILYQNLADNNPVEVIHTNRGTKYILVLDGSSGGNDLPIKRTSDAADAKFMVYDEMGNLVDNLPKELQGGIYFKKITSSSYGNKYKNPEVRYFETDPFKGAPALVPLDTEKGWYVAMSQSLPGFGSVRSFDESGRVYSYYLGNVGPDGNVNFFEGGGDDIYQLVVLGSQVTFSRFPGLSESEVSTLVRKAESAILEVQRQYSSVVGRANAKVNVPGITEAILVGQPASNAPQVECEDFMSPQQCKILFNVCDPVICPSSRCDLGGAYPVADVVQSGVIGSVALCLPNFQEGIVIPVCLTGVQAGIDNWASIQKSYRSCLQEQIETGKTVGICDEIQSIYGCEFFWRQSLPVAKIIVPTVISTLLGQNTRGGGEYLGVASAWENAEKSVQYFTQIYGEDSFKAFKARSTDEVGGALCKSFVSGVYPSSGNFLNTLTAPDSPFQATARFDEIPFTTATNPPVSQYKVFYHIFAGKDSGAYFRVYLKGSPGSSYYQDTAVSRVVAYGYVERGGFKTDTVDFTAPSGYGKVCVLVNGQENCDFKQVSTDFSLNYIKDQYAKEQAEDSVTSESACISGTPSLYSLVSPNIQEGASDYFNPELYNQGIYRICATDNPGRGTDGATGTQSQRWIDVGYCGNQNLRCWLDTQSVKDVIKNSNIENETLQSINERIQAELKARGESPNFENTISQIETEKDNFNKIKIINEVIGKFFFNYQKGWLLIMRGDVYGDLAFGMFKENNDKAVATKVSIETFAADFGSPVFEFKDGTNDLNIYYRYSADVWEWSKDERYWFSASENNPTISTVVATGSRSIGESKFENKSVEISQANKAFIARLVGKSYIDGLTLLIERTRNNNEGGLFTAAVRFVGLSSADLSTDYVTMDSAGRFRIFPANRVFEFNGGWKWSPFPLREFVLVPEKYLTYPLTNNLDLVRVASNLKGKDFLNGAILIFDYGYVATAQPSGLSDPLLPDPTMVNSRFADTELFERLSLYDNLIKEASQKYEINEEFIKAMIIQESYAQPDVTDNVGSWGLMQVSSIAALDVKNYYKDTEHDSLYLQYTANPKEPSPNVKMGTAFFKRLMDYYNSKGNSGESTQKISLAAYNCGIGNVQKICTGESWTGCTKERFEQYCTNNDVLQYVSNIIAYDRKMRGVPLGESSSTPTSSVPAGALLPIKIIITQHDALFGTTWLTNDREYSWNGTAWDFTPAFPNNYNLNTYSGGLQFIKDTILNTVYPGDMFENLAISCGTVQQTQGTKKLVLAIETNIKNIDILEKIKEASQSLCKYDVPDTQPQPSSAEEIETTVCPVPVSPTFSSSVLAVSAANARVLKAAEELDGEPAPGNNCFQPIETLYKNAGLGFSCVYPDEAGKQYTIGGETVTIGVDKNQYGEIIHNVPATRNTCLVKNTITYQQKLDNLQPGDQLDIVWSSNFGHAVIFVKWIDKANKKAEIFDWLDGVKGARIYRYAEMSLAEDQHPVYIHRRPVIKSS